MRPSGLGLQSGSVAVGGGGLAFIACPPDPGDGEMARRILGRGSWRQTAFRRCAGRWRIASSVCRSTSGARLSTPLPIADILAQIQQIRRRSPHPAGAGAGPDPARRSRGRFHRAAAGRPAASGFRVIPGSRARMASRRWPAAADLPSSSSSRTSLWRAKGEAGSRASAAREAASASS